MATVSFTPNIQRHVSCPDCKVAGKTIREILDSVFKNNPKARGYILDEQGSVRAHMVIFVDGQQISDREHLSDAVGRDADVYIMQALSGG